MEQRRVEGRKIKERANRKKDKNTERIREETRKMKKSSSEKILERKAQDRYKTKIQICSNIPIRFCTDKIKRTFNR
jgi:hypothetical protein